ncbi:acyloxyacyl hydrolase [Pseudomonas sp. HN2-3]|uniref:acyloxyacyl hydrolase n=1 Tax=Pseudomonas sp. HN2-3 TaxID=2886360 RepID=UPI001D10918F|nr:acyloxyacyl hydrolase [Pseudomonas sp. HN2-3]
MAKIFPSLFAALLVSVSASIQAAETSGAVGVTTQGDMTYRAGLGWQWDKRWLESSTGHLGGYWDVGYTYWEGGDEASGRHSISAAPVFEYVFGDGFYKPFIEAGIGASFFSGTSAGDQKLGSSFNFEDRLGAGVKIDDTQRVGVRVIHYSNAGLAQPNDGIESYSLFYAHQF